MSDLANVEFCLFFCPNGSMRSEKDGKSSRKGSCARRGRSSVCAGGRGGDWCRWIVGRFIVIFIARFVFVLAISGVGVAGTYGVFIHEGEDGDEDGLETLT
jgi:hypothetical protein